MCLMNFLFKEKRTKIYMKAFQHMFVKHDFFFILKVSVQKLLSCVLKIHENLSSYAFILFLICEGITHQLTL